MATDTRARPERHEPEWLGSRGVDDLGDIEREVTGNICHLVGEGDVDGTKRVLEELGELGRLR
jgi:hypothetical protein